MQLIFVGTGAFGVPGLRALAASGHRVVGAISQPDRPAGRGLKVQPTPVHQAADELHIPHIQTPDINSLDWPAWAAEAKIAVVAAFGQKLSAATLARQPRGFLNIHASLLPKYRGAAPYQWAIIAGEAVTGVTVFQIDPRWDAGPIWGAATTPIGETETADELHDRLAGLGAPLIVQTLDQIDRGSAQPRAQDPSLASRAPKLTRADAHIDWSQPATAIVRRIHGLWSWPAASCTFAAADGRRERIQLARARIADCDALPTADRPPGSFLPQRHVQTGRGRVQLLEVKRAGGKLMLFDAFANGRRIQPGDRLQPLDEHRDAGSAHSQRRADVPQHTAPDRMDLGDASHEV